MNFIYRTLSALFGTIFFLLALSFLVLDYSNSYVLAAAAFFNVCLLVPSSRDFFYRHTNKTLPSSIRVFLVFGVTIFISVLLNESTKENIAQWKEQAELKAEIDRNNKLEELKKEYVKEEGKIHAAIEKAMQDKNYKNTFDLINKYAAVAKEQMAKYEKLAITKEALEMLENVPESDARRKVHFYQKLVAANPETDSYKSKLAYYQKEVDEINRRKIKQEKDSILAELRKVPVSDYETNLSLYQKLAKMEPSNNKFQEKINFYADKIMQAKARKKSLESQFSSWDGSHRNVERAIKSMMHNPNSYEHVKTRYADNGKTLTIMTTYRGTNAFGATVTNTSIATVDLNGNVLSIE